MLRDPIYDIRNTEYGHILHDNPYAPCILRLQISRHRIRRVVHFLNLLHHHPACLVARPRFVVQYIRHRRHRNITSPGNLFNRRHKASLIRSQFTFTIYLKIFLSYLSIF